MTNDTLTENDFLVLGDEAQLTRSLEQLQGFVGDEAPTEGLNYDQKLALHEQLSSNDPFGDVDVDGILALFN